MGGPRAPRPCTRPMAWKPRGATSAGRTETVVWDTRELPYSLREQGACAQATRTHSCPALREPSLLG